MDGPRGGWGGGWTLSYINAPKISGQCEFGKVPETPKYTKQGFPVLQSYNQNKGDRWKIPIN
jgi:hypothetical protein